MRTLPLLLFSTILLNAATYTVKSSGGGNFTTIQACANAMAAGDTCTVYAGTYNENVALSAGSAGNYKTLTVNGGDVVYVQGFVAASYTKIVGFHIQYPSSPGSGCVSIPNGTQYLYIRNNIITQCGVSAKALINISYPSTASYVFIQGNTISYGCANPGSTVCDSILAFGDHWLIENNDISHYTLSIDYVSTYSVFRNNTFHDQYETEAGGNHHTDIFFSEPGVSTYPSRYNLIEGNFQYNAFGANAKSVLNQNDSAPNNCGANCSNIIERFNTFSRIGGAVNSNNGVTSWPYIKVYNNTEVDTGQDLGLLGYDGTLDNSVSVPNASFLNQLYYFGATNPFTANSPYGYITYEVGANSVYGNNLMWCEGGARACTPVYGHDAVTAFTNDPNNQFADPKFVNYVSAGSLSNDYHLQNGSPAIAAGTYLTTVASSDSGSGTSLVVNDASYFQDGYGLSNAYSTVNPDCIAVGTASNHICVTAVNYTTNTLTLASSISRSTGQGVYLYSKSDGLRVLTGTAPDIGAYPYTGSNTSSPAPPSSMSAVVH